MLKRKIYVVNENFQLWYHGIFHSDVISTVRMKCIYAHNKIVNIVKLTSLFLIFSYLLRHDLSHVMRYGC